MQVSYRGVPHIILILITTVGTINAEEGNPGMNAALRYWSALVSIPENPRQTQWEIAKDDPLSVSLQDAEFLLMESGVGMAAQWTLADLRRGGKMPYCDWGLPIQETGPDTLLHHAQRAGTATGLLLLDARVEHSRANWSAAIEDLKAAWAFQRHLAHDGTLVSWVGSLDRTERLVVPLAASWLPGLEESALRKFELGLRRLPAIPTLGDVLRAEGDMWAGWLRRRFERDGLASIRTWLVQVAERRNLKAVGREMEATISSEKEFFHLLDATHLRFEDAARIATLPFDEFKPAAVRFQNDIAFADPLTRLLLGSSWITDRPVLGLRDREAKSQAGLAMFNAAIAMRLEGRPGFERVRDPFGAGPFEIRDVEGGFTLSSHLEIEAKPFTMNFGKGAAPVPRLTSRLLFYDPKADAAATIKDASKKAGQEKKRVLLQWGFNGCIPCYQLHRMLEDDPGLSEILRNRFVRISIDVTNENNGILAEKYGVDLSSFPSVTILDESGSAIANVKPAEAFSAGGSLDTGLIRNFLEKWTR